MSDDARQQPVEELEVSLRTQGLLEELGVRTVGELLDLPRIVIPAEWPGKVAGLVARELEELFAELGLEYAGEIVVPPRPAPALRATGDVVARWKTIAAWLGDAHPHALEHWNPPASPEAIAAAEARLGHALPDDYKQFLAIHDGQRDLAPMVSGSLLPLAEVIEAKADIVGEATPVDADDVDPGVRAVDYSPGWVPISRSARGRDYLCLDLDPAPGGVRGQIVEYVVDDNARRVVAKSFADLLSLYFERAQTGELDLDEDLEDD